LAEILKPKDAFAHMTAISKLPKALKPKKAAKKQRKNPVPIPTIPTPSAAVLTQTPDIKTLPLPWGAPQVWAEVRVPRQSTASSTS